LAEQQTLNLRVDGSIPSRLTSFPLNLLRISQLRLLWPVEATDPDIIVVIIRSFIEITDSSGVQEDRG
jgi:hypothetical protein